MLLIDCDILNPDPKKISDLSMLTRYLFNLPLLKNLKKIIPVIVTPRECENYDDNYDVIIINKSRIEQLIKMVQYKDEIDILHDLLMSFSRIRFA